jgi:hypothetical protein
VRWHRIWSANRGRRRGGKQRRTSRRLISTKAPKQQRGRVPVGLGATEWWEIQEHCCGKRAMGKVSCIVRVALKRGRWAPGVRRDKPDQGVRGSSVAPNGGSFAGSIHVARLGVCLVSAADRLSLLFQQGDRPRFHQGPGVVMFLGGAAEGDDARVPGCTSAPTSRPARQRDARSDRWRSGWPCVRSHLAQQSVCCVCPSRRLPRERTGLSPQTMLRCCIRSPGDAAASLRLLSWNCSLARPCGLVCP